MKPYQIPQTVGQIANDVERLRNAIKSGVIGATECKAEIKRLQAQLEQLRMALKKMIGEVEK